MANYDTIVVDVEDGVQTITLNRPDHHNGMTVEMTREVHDVLSGTALDPTIRVVVLTGAGNRFFCPGADVGRVHANSSEQSGVGRFNRSFEVRVGYRVPVLLRTIPQVTVAALNGSAAGAGLGWAMACDLRWSVTTARFATAFLDRAVAGDMCLHWTLPRVVGPGRARQLMLTCRKIDAAEASTIGMVDDLFEPDAFSSGVAEGIDRLRRAAPLALRTIKQNLLAAEQMTIADFCDLETMRHIDLLATEDVGEGFASFVEGRAPVFRGR